MDETTNMTAREIIFLAEQLVKVIYSGSPKEEAAKERARKIG